MHRWLTQTFLCSFQASLVSARHLYSPSTWHLLHDSKALQTHQALNWIYDLPTHTGSSPTFFFLRENINLPFLFFQLELKESIDPTSALRINSINWFPEINQPESYESTLVSPSLPSIISNPSLSLVNCTSLIVFKSIHFTLSPALPPSSKPSDLGYCNSFLAGPPISTLSS